MPGTIEDTMYFHDVCVHQDMTEEWRFVVYLCYTNEGISEVHKVIEENKGLVNKIVDGSSILSFVIGFGKLEIAKKLVELGVEKGEPDILFEEALRCDVGIGPMPLVQYLIKDLHLTPSDEVKKFAGQFANTEHSNLEGYYLGLDDATKFLLGSIEQEQS